jgi:predicted dehydrogenase
MRNGKLKVAFVGLGNQALNDHIPSVLKRNDLRVVSVCDKSKLSQDKFFQKFPKCKGTVSSYSDFSKMPLKGVDFFVVSVPHDQYPNVVKRLVLNKKYFIKEKPLARNVSEMRQMLSLRDFDKYCFVCTQRRYGKIFKEALKKKNIIGDAFLFNSSYKLNIPNPEAGWRGDKKKAGGGCVIDMGYHIIDQLLWWFGEPDEVFVSKSSLAVPDVQDYAEDTAVISFRYLDGLHGTITLSRSAGEKSEGYSLVGSKGCLYGTKRELVVKDKEGNILLEKTQENDSEMTDKQLQFFIQRVKHGGGFGDVISNHRKNIEFIDRCYRASEIKH